MNITKETTEKMRLDALNRVMMYLSKRNNHEYVISIAHDITEQDFEVVDETISGAARTFLIRPDEYCRDCGVMENIDEYLFLRRDLELVRKNTAWIPMPTKDYPKRKILISVIEDAVENGDGTFSVTITRELMLAISKIVYMNQNL